MEYFLEATDTDIAVSTIIEWSGISKPKVYQIVEDFIKKNYVIKSRIIGRTQLYKLNKNNPVVKIFIRNFNECLNMVIEENSKKNKNTINTKILVTTKNI